MLHFRGVFFRKKTKQKNKWSNYCLFRDRKRFFHILLEREHWELLNCKLTIHGLKKVQKGWLCVILENSSKPSLGSVLKNRHKILRVLRVDREILDMNKQTLRVDRRVLRVDGRTDRRVLRVNRLVLRVEKQVLRVVKRVLQVEKRVLRVAKQILRVLRVA